MSERQASCSCGQLRVVAGGEPLSVGICHCLACQRRAGSAYGYQARYPLAAVPVTGRSHEYVRHSDEEREERRCHFRPDCGSTVYPITGDSRDTVVIAAGALADPGFLAPAVSVWEKRKHDWVTPPAGAEHIN